MIAFCFFICCPTLPLITIDPYILNTREPLPQKGRSNQWCSKGTCQKRFSGIRPLRGVGYPLSAKEKTFFFPDDFPLRGGWGYPPIPLRKKTFFLAPKTLFFAFFYAFLALFGPLYGLFGPFLTLFNEKNIIFSPFRKKFPGKA